MTDEIMQGQIMLTDLLGQDSWCGKTCQEHSAQTKARILEPSLKKQPNSQTKMPLFLDLRTANGHIPDVSWETGGALPGEYTMHSFGESPSAENESRLSQILEANAHQKYYLSEKACQGILRRAEKRGKKLPEMLEQALRKQAGLMMSESAQTEQKIGERTATKLERAETLIRGGANPDSNHGGICILNDNQPVCFEPGAMSRVGGHIYGDDKSGTVRANAGDNQQAVCLNSWDVQSKHIQPENGIAESLYAGECRGGGGESYVMQSKVYGISSYDSNGMKSANPNSGIYEADTSRTLDNNGGNPACNQGGMMVVEGVDIYNMAMTGEKGRTLSAAGGGLNEHIPVVLDNNGGNPACNQGGMVVVQGFDSYNQASTGDVAMPLRNKAADSDHIPVVCIEGNGQRESHKGDGYKESDTMYTLNSTEHHAVCVKNPSVVNVEMEVSVRKYEVDKNRLIECLQKHKTMPLQKIAEALNVPKTMVEHWFRKDSCFSVPDADIWLQLKTLLNIDTDEFDESIMTYEVKPGNYDTRNRIHMGDVAPTLNTQSENTVYCLENHPKDSRVKISDDGKVQTLSAAMGTGGGNVPMVMESEPILLANNQNEAEISQTGICNTLPAAMGMGGGYVPMITETYQKTTGSLCASGYNKLGTQEAPNDMFVVEPCSWDGGQVSPTLTANNAGGSQRMPDKDNFNAVIQSMEVYHCTTEENKVQTLKARDYKDPQCVAYGIDSYNQTASEEITESLRSADGGDSKPKVCYGIDRAAYNQGQNAKFDFSIDKEMVGPQTARGPGAVCQPETYQKITETVCARISAGTSNQLASDDMFVANTSIVRRLTPLECTRLQGFPDGWVDIGEWVDSKGKVRKDSDANKYKALGNSIALPFWEWMAKRMIKVLNVEHPTMASLFDGIGGFPLSYSRAGCEPVWASEIEEFPIAVTKVRFPEK